MLIHSFEVRVGRVDDLIDVAIDLVRPPSEFVRNDVYRLLLTAQDDAASNGHVGLVFCGPASVSG